MPTGYTADLYDGKDQSFPEFALACARAFGALILMRDDPKDAPIPDEFAPDDYHVKKIAEARAEFDRLVSMTNVEADAEAVRLADEWDAARAAEEATRLARKARYEAMRDEAEAWDPPTSEHQGLKEFMVKQLTESIDFDCFTYEFPSPPRDGSTWRHEAVAKAKRDIEYHTAEHAKEVERAAGRSAWVQALRHSLAPVDNAV